MPRTLYDLTDELSAIYDQIVEAGGEITDEIEAVLETLESDVEQKAHGYARIIQNLDAEAKMFAAEEKRLKARRVAAERSRDSLKERLLMSMRGLGRTEIRTPIGIWRRVQPSSKRVVVADRSRVPEEYMRTRDPEPNLAEIAAALDAGEIVDGAYFADSSDFIRFY